MKVKDLMVPIGEYARVNPDSNLYDALLALKTAQAKLPEGKAPHRAVLVENEFGSPVGNIGRLVFIKALAAGFSRAKTRDEMDRAGISPESISTVMSHMDFFQRNLGSLEERARAIKARDVMHPVGESIDESATFQEALNLFGAGQTLSILVKRGNSVVGVLRLSDVFQEVANRILTPETDQKAEG